MKPAKTRLAHHPPDEERDREHRGAEGEPDERGRRADIAAQHADGGHARQLQQGRQRETGEQRDGGEEPESERRETRWRQVGAQQTLEGAQQPLLRHEAERGADDGGCDRDHEQLHQ